MDIAITLRLTIPLPEDMAGKGQTYLGLATEIGNLRVAIERMGGSLVEVKAADSRISKNERCRNGALAHWAKASAEQRAEWQRKMQAGRHGAAVA